MAIIQYKTEGFDNLMHTESDAGFKILQNETGIVYDGADDVIPVRYTYSETTEKIENPKNEVDING